MKFDTKAIHAGQSPDPTTGAIMTPVYLTSTYVQASPGEHQGFEYSRTQNPTRFALEGCIAALEGGAHGLAFSSGCATTDAVMHLLDAGDHVVCMDDVYGGTFRLFDKVWRRHGIDYTFADLTDPEALKAAFTDKTKLVWVETPTNPLLKIVDLEVVAKAAKAHGALMVVDNTFMTPYIQRPLELGADIVVHSTTKYLNGHSDVVGGAWSRAPPSCASGWPSSRTRWARSPAPWTASWCSGASRPCTCGCSATWRTPGTWRAGFPSTPRSRRSSTRGSPATPSTRWRSGRCDGFGGMITVRLKGGLESSRRFLTACKVFALAESLGGVESLIEHPAIMTHASVPADQRARLGISDGLVRLSVGIEALDDLREDLSQALDAA